MKPNRQCRFISELPDEDEEGHKLVLLFGNQEEDGKFVLSNSMFLPMYKDGLQLGYLQQAINDAPENASTQAIVDKLELVFAKIVHFGDEKIFRKMVTIHKGQKLARKLLLAQGMRTPDSSSDSSKGYAFSPKTEASRMLKARDDEAHVI